jgi:hypothetical protein
METEKCVGYMGRWGKDVHGASDQVDRVKTWRQRLSCTADVPQQPHLAENSSTKIFFYLKQIAPEKGASIWHPLPTAHISAVAMDATQTWWLEAMMGCAVVGWGGTILTVKG